MKNKRDSEKINATNAFLTDRGISIFYENCDFLTVKLNRRVPFVETLLGIVPNSDVLVLDFWKFKIQYFGLVAGDLLKVLHLLDSQNNIVAVIHLKTELGTESRAKSFSDDIEFVGLFWTAYAHYFPAFCDLFGIDPTKSGIVSRFDYCVDLAGVDASEILLLVSDKLAKASTIRVWNVETYRKIETPQRHALVVYNKRLDVLDKRKHKIEVDPIEPDGPLRRPFLRYVEARFPIARVEYRKKARALREMADSSIVSLQLYARQLSADHFSTYFEIDLQTVFENLSEFERVPFPSKDDTLVNGMVDDKAKAYLNLAFAYADNYSLLKGQKQFFRHLFQKYGTHLYDWAIRESDFEPVHQQAAYDLFPSPAPSDAAKRPKQKSAAFR